MSTKPNLTSADVAFGLMLTIAFGFCGVSMTLFQIFAPDVSSSTALVSLFGLVAAVPLWFVMSYVNDFSDRRDSLATDGGERR